jgi:hypothetical protein
MEIDRRGFISAVGSVLAVSGLIVTEGCGDSGAAVQTKGRSELDAAALLRRAAADGELQVAAR